MTVLTVGLFEWVRSGLVLLVSGKGQRGGGGGNVVLVGGQGEVYLGSGISRGLSEFGSPGRWAPTYAWPRGHRMIILRGNYYRTRSHCPLDSYEA